MRTTHSHCMRKLQCAVYSAVAVIGASQGVYAADSVAPDAEPIRFAPAAAHAEAYSKGVSLKQLVAEALKNNPEIRAAANEREAASQRVAPAAALDDPMLEAGLLNLPTRSFSFNREDMTMKMLGLSQRIPYPGKRALKRDIAERDSESVAHAYQETVNRIARDVSTTYYELAFVQESMRVVQQNRAVVTQLLKVVEGRHSVGRATQVEVLKTQTQLSRMSEEQIKLERERPMLEAELNRMLGRPAHNAPPLTLLPKLDTAAASAASPEESTWANRPQLRALQTMVSRADRALELAQKDRYPDFDVRFAYGQRDSMPDGTRRSDLVSMTVAINLPVWRATKTGPRIAEAQALQEQAVNLYEAQRNETATRLHHQAATAEQSLRAARLYDAEILPQSRLTFEAALAAYQVNRGELMPMLDAQMAIFNAELGYASAVSSYHKALAEIQFLSGGATEHTMNDHTGSMQ
jgi:outer membrane protein, heavy metal efflux system